MAGEGQLLRTAREKKHWKLLDAEDVTKIRVRYLQAMEEEDYSVLPGPAYVKGFLRTYAKHLDLDTEEIVALYKSSAAQEAAPALQGPLTPMKTRPVWLRPAVALVMSAVVIVLVIGIATWTQKQGTSLGSGYTPPALPTAPPPQKPSQEASLGNAGSGTSNSDASGSSSANPASGSSAPAQAQNNGAANAGNGITAKLVFTQDVWLSMQVDGDKPVQNYFTAGTTKEIQAKDKIEFLTIGNAGGVTITLNGKTVPSLGSEGQVKNNIVFDKENLNTL